MELNLKKIGTEQRNPNTMKIDVATTREVVRLINEEDKTVALAVEKEIDAITALVDAIVIAFKKQGRLIYAGAGTSGRIGIIDAVECRPTFSVSEDTVQCIMAGGVEALVSAAEGAEDSRSMAIDDLKRIQVNKNDIVIGITASGRTPYAVSAVEYAKAQGATTGCITTSPASEIADLVDFPVQAITGAEPITGSTRMKSGTAQKMICNILSSASMIKMGKVYENLMIDLQPTNEKLFRRAESTIIDITGVSVEEARVALKTYGSVKKTVFALLTGIKDLNKINAHLNHTQGHLRNALESVKK